MLDVFRLIVDECPHARLWIAGAGPLEAALRKQCERLGLNSVVQFIGFVPDLPSFFPLVDLQVHPSKNEGIPLSICEGMAAGLPMVATAVGGVPEILDHGRCGLLVPANDRAAFVTAVVSLIRDEAEAKRLGDTARQHIAENYSIVSATNELSELYLRLHASRTKR